MNIAMIVLFLNLQEENAVDKYEKKSNKKKLYKQLLTFLCYKIFMYKSNSM